MGNANPSYLRAWPAEQLVTGGGAAIVYGTPAELLAGTDTTKLYSAATLSSVSVAGISAGVGDAGKFIRLDATGKLNPNFLPDKAMEYQGGIAPTAAAPAAPAIGDIYTLSAAGTFAASWTGVAGTTGAAGDMLIWDGAAWVRNAGSSGGSVTYGTSAELIAGTDTTKVYNAATIASSSISGASAGAADAGKYVRLDSNGKLDSSMMDPASVSDVIIGVGGKVVDAASLALASVKFFGSAADNGKYVRVSGTGKIDATLLPDSAMEYKGGTAATAAAPAAPNRGDVYIVNAAGTFPASWSGISGQTGGVGDQIMFDGTNWLRMPYGGGDVVGPASATDNAVARYDATTGKLIQNSAALLTDTGELQVGAGSAATPSLSFTGDPNTGVYSYAADQIGFATNGVARASVNDFAFVVGGTPTSNTILAVQSTGGNQLNVERYNAASTSGPVINYRKSLSGTVGTHTAVTNGTTLYTQNGQGSDGSAFVQATAISSFVDGAPAAGVVPGRLAFLTANSAGAVLERFSIRSSGNVGVNNNTPSSSLEVKGTISQNYTGLVAGVMDLSTAQIFVKNLIGATTWSFTNVPAIATTVTLYLANGGSAVQTWPASVEWEGGAAPVLSVGGGVDIITFQTYDGGVSWFGAAISKNHN